MDIGSIYTLRDGASRALANNQHTCDARPAKLRSLWSYRRILYGAVGGSRAPSSSLQERRSPAVFDAVR